ncbi:Metalloprotease [Daldinia bambusicola]|nr:Metalloprotease [Daldinia bambusicola]
MYPVDQGRNYYRCSTQKNRLPALWQPPLSEDPSDSDSIVVGMSSIVPRWDVPGSNTTLEFFVRADSFPSADDVSYATQMFQQAADDWNALGLGVSISQAADEMKANFDLVYRVNGRADQGLYAVAFFPHERHSDVVVTDFALSAKERGTLKNVFLHEIGHILGLRHEFALDKEGEGAVRFMEENPVSVMSYTSPPIMQESDRVGVKEFYKLERGLKIGGSPIVDFQPELRR